MRPRALPVIVVGGLVIAVVLLVVRLGSLRGGGQPALAAAPVPQPGRDNVAPSYHTREMRLRARVDSVPTDTTALGELGRLLQDSHRSAEAAGLLERYAAIAPVRQVLLDLAVAHEAAGDLEAAKRAVDRLLERYPDDPAGLYDRGAIEANLGNNAAAVEWFERAAAQRVDTAMAAAARAALERLTGPQ